MKSILFIFLSLPSFLFAKELRLVSLDPAITELIYQSDLKDKLVGVTTYCNFPDEVTKINKVGTYNQPKLEKILSLKPSHILVMKSGRPNLKFPKKLGIKLVELEGTKLSDFLKNLKTLESELGVKLSQHKKNWLTEDCESLEVNKSAVILVGTEPFVLASKSTFLSEGLSYSCGIKNLVKTEASWPNLPIEKLASYKPEIVIQFQMTESTKNQNITLWPNAKHYQFRGDEYLRLGPRLPAALNKVCKELLK